MKSGSNLWLFLEVNLLQTKWIFGIGIAAAAIASLYFIIKLELRSCGIIDDGDCSR